MKGFGREPHRDNNAKAANLSKNTMAGIVAGTLRTTRTGLARRFLHSSVNNCAFQEPHVCGTQECQPVEAVNLPPVTPSSSDFQRFADDYVNGLWKKLEYGLQQASGSGSCQLNVRSDGVTVICLPGLAQVTIRKDPQRETLSVESDLLASLPSCWSTGYEAPFRLKKGVFECYGETLHSHLEYGLAKHLNIHVDLDPTAEAAARGDLH